MSDQFTPATSFLVVACVGRSRYFDLDAVRCAPTSGEAGAFVKDRDAGSAFRGVTDGANDRRELVSNPAGAPPLDWWNIPGEAVCQRVVKAMCPEKVCRVCGKPSERITSEPVYVQTRTGGVPAVLDQRQGVQVDPMVRQWATPGMGDNAVTRTVETLGWTDCGHDNWRRGLVLDPFNLMTERDAMGQARYLIGDVFDRLAEIPDGSVDLIMTSPPFLALRSYLPADHPDKGKEIGSEPTPAVFLDTLLALTAEWRRVLAPHGSICVELGDTYSGSGGAGGDYAEGGMRDGQPMFRQGYVRNDRPNRPPQESPKAYGNGGPRPAREGRGDGWPLAKSLTFIPQLYGASLAYGRNLLTGEPSPAGQWRVRNVVAWCRPNPPVGALGDKFRPATSYLTVACVGRSRYFDLDAVREPYSPNTNARTAKGTDRRENTTAKANAGGNNNRDTLGIVNNDGAGAPPLDWWEIPTQPSTAGEIGRRVRVPVDVHGDGIQRTMSPDCPVHGSLGHPGSSAPDGEREATRSSRTERSGDHPALALGLDFPPTSSSTGPTASDEVAAAPAATGRSTPSRRTDLGPATTPSGTPSAQTPHRTGGTQDGPSSSSLHHDTHESSTWPDDLDERRQRMTAHTANTSPGASPCSCSYWIELDVSSEPTSDYAGIPEDYWIIPTQAFSGSHYATWPEALLVRPIKAMCPERVCRTCGKPSERIVEQTSQEYAETAAAAKAFGLRRTGSETGAAVGYSKGNKAQSLIQNGTIAPVLETLGWTDCGCIPATAPDPTCSSCGGTGIVGNVRRDGAVDVCFACVPGSVCQAYHNHGGECDGNRWRRGLVLDPFAGSGTTLAVAVGHGRDALGIDLDSRNADLARERCGMFLTVDEPSPYLSERPTVDVPPSREIA